MCDLGEKRSHSPFDRKYSPSFGECETLDDCSTALMHIKNDSAINRQSALPNARHTIYSSIFVVSSSTGQRLHVLKQSLSFVLGMHKNHTQHTPNTFESLDSLTIDTFDRTLWYFLSWCSASAIWLNEHNNFDLGAKLDCDIAISFSS